LFLLFLFSFSAWLGFDWRGNMFSPLGHSREEEDSGVEGAFLSVTCK